MNREQLQSLLSGLKNTGGLPAPIQEKITSLNERLDLVTSEQFEKWTDGIVTSAAQEEDRHWGFRTEVQELYADLCKCAEQGQGLLSSQTLDQLGQMVQSAQPLRRS